MAEEDPFASIIDQCKYSSSQEDLLRYCLFCRESQEGLLAFSNQESEELEVASTGLIICSPPDTQPEEELQVASQALIICSAPDTQPEEDFQTPEERLLVSSEEQWMDLDEHVESIIDGVDDGDTVEFDGDVVDSVDDASPDLAGTVDLGNDSYVNFSEENSVAGNGSPVPRAVHVDDDDDDNSVPLVEKSPEGKVLIEILPLQEGSGLPEPMGEGLKLPLPMNEGLELPEPMNDSLGLPEPMNDGLRLSEPMAESLELSEPSEGLGHTLSKKLITYEMNLQLLAVDNVDSLVGRSREICLVGVVEKTVESLVEKNLGSLKPRCNSPSMSSPKSPQEPQKIATYGNVDDGNAHTDLYFEKDDMLVVHPVTNVVEVMGIAVRNNSGVLMCCADAVIEDASLIATEKGLVREISTEKVLEFDIPQTDVVRNEEGKRGSYNMEGLGEVGKAGSSDIPPESEDLSGLRKLPNWVGGKDNAMGNLRHSGKRRVGEADCFNRSGINKVGEGEGSGCGGGRVGEVDGIDTGRRLGEETGLGHGGKRTAGDVGCSSAVTEALSSLNEYDDMMNLLAATFLRENNRYTGSGLGGGRVEEVGGSDYAGRKLGEGMCSDSHGKDTVRSTGIGHAGGRVEEVDGSGSAESRLGKGKGPSSHGKKTAGSKGSGGGGGKTAGDAEGSSRVTSSLSSGNQFQAMMNFLTASFLRETNVNKGNVDNSNENSQNKEDILEVAIRAGLEFPRPRWWKPEGYETRRDK